MRQEVRLAQCCDSAVVEGMMTALARLQQIITLHRHRLLCKFKWVWKQAIFSQLRLQKINERKQYMQMGKAVFGGCATIKDVFTMLPVMQLEQLHKLYLLIMQSTVKMDCLTAYSQALLQTTFHSALNIKLPFLVHRRIPSLVCA